MKPRIKLAEQVDEQGRVMALYEHDGAFSINFNGQELMHSKASASESLLGEIGVEKLGDSVQARVLIGGLGLGFTLKSVLSNLPSDAVVEVAELVPEIVEWNRSFLESLNGKEIEDPRVQIFEKDVVKLLKKREPETYDSIMLDIDNGPIAMVSGGNNSLYSKIGLKMILGKLKAGGRAVFWSAGPDIKFADRLKKTGFHTTAVPAKTHDGAKRAAYLLYVANKKRED